MYDGIIKLFDTATCQCIQRHSFLDNFTNNCIIFPPDATLLAIFRDNYLYVVNADLPQEKWSSRSQKYYTKGKIDTGHTQNVTELVFSADSLRLASAAGGRTIRIWDMVTRACLQKLDIAANPVLQLRFESPISLYTIGGTIQLSEKSMG